jgi:hypothetical protein
MEALDAGPDIETGEGKVLTAIDFRREAAAPCRDRAWRRCPRRATCNGVDRADKPVRPRPKGWCPTSKRRSEAATPQTCRRGSWRIFGRRNPTPIRTLVLSLVMKRCPVSVVRNGFRRIHSRYRRHVTDLPLSGRIVQLLVIARRFRCDAVLCRRQIFTERFAEGG